MYSFISWEIVFMTSHLCPENKSKSSNLLLLRMVWIWGVNSVFWDNSLGSAGFCSNLPAHYPSWGWHLNLCICVNLHGFPCYSSRTQSYLFLFEEMCLLRIVLCSLTFQAIICISTYYCALYSHKLGFLNHFLPPCIDQLY